MSRKSGRAPLVLTDEQKVELIALAGSRTAPLREVERAKILLSYATGLSISEIGRCHGVSRPTIYKCIDKALAAGVRTGLKDTYHRPYAPEITEEAKTWVVSIACAKPKDFDLAAEVWSISALAQYVSAHAEAAGFPRLSRAGKSTIWRILEENRLKPHKIAYYLEKRDPDFDRKMHEILMVYKEISLQPEGRSTEEPGTPWVYTVSVDEKPGIQALALTAPDLPPIPGKARTIRRDYEYVRHGTASILAGIDLHSGHLFARVEERHRSREFISLLQSIDAYYPPEATLRIILDNHSAHISKETMAYLATRPGRFEYIHTPKHGSWLNLIECAFSKMARSFLRHIRVNSLEELKARILKGVKEMNEHPVVFRWKKFDLEIA